MTAMEYLPIIACIIYKHTSNTNFVSPSGMAQLQGMPKMAGFQVALPIIVPSLTA